MHSERLTNEFRTEDIWLANSGILVCVRVTWKKRQHRRLDAPSQWTGNDELYFFPKLRGTPPNFQLFASLYSLLFSLVQQRRIP